MRTRILILTGALLLASSGLALAQQTATTTPPATPKLGLIDVGVRVDDVSGDEARYNRFRDIRDGLFLQKFRLEKETDTWFARGTAANLGYRDQEFGAAFESIGRLKVNFDWVQTPFFISGTSRSLYSANGSVLSIDDSIQRSIQNATANGTAARDAAITAALAGAPQFDLRSRRDVGAFKMVYTLNRDVDFKFNVKNTHRKGNNLMGFGFGTSPGLSPLVEMGVPTDDRSTDVNGSVEFANTKGLLAFGYTGSWYDNSIPFVQFDNPLRADSISGGPAVGQAVLWPSSSTFSVNANGSYKLTRTTRANASLSVGRQTQDEPLAPATINTALVAPTLPRTTANAKADVIAATFGLNSRPVENLWLNLKYRFNDFNNKTAHYETTALIGDWSVGTAHLENEPGSVKRQMLDLDASYTPVDYLTFGVGFGRDDVHRTWRIFEETAENMFRVSVDSIANQYVTLRAKYEYSKREGSGFESHLLDEVGEQPLMRHYDVANRKRGRFTSALVITPISWFALNGSVSTGRDDYYETGFGLRDNKNRTWSAGFDVIPMDTVTFGLNYGYEKYTAFQYSRTANPLSATDQTFNDPTRDWWIDSDDIVKTVTASLDLIKAIPKTDIRISYDFSDGDATYVYGMKPEQRVFTTTPLTQLSPVSNRLTGARFDFQYFIRANVALGIGYWYEEYKVKDFALDGTAINQLNPASAATGLFASTIYSGYLYRPYTAHTTWLKMSYLW